MTTGPTPAQVAAQVAMVRRHRPEERVIGIHMPGGWLGGATLQVNGESCTAVYCRSGLQVREAWCRWKERVLSGYCYSTSRRGVSTGC